MNFAKLCELEDKRIRKPFDLGIEVEWVDAAKVVVPKLLLLKEVVEQLTERMPLDVSKHLRKLLALIDGEKS